MTPVQNDDLHGNAPDECPIALLIVDMINDFEFPEGDRLFEAALPAAENIARLKQQANKVGIPTIYINDNFGKWRSDLHQQVTHCLDEPVRGQPIARLLSPQPDDYSVIKPKHSAFYATPLDLLLTYLKVNTLILTGIAGDVCILFTANDAYMREYHLVVPSDCIASQTPEDNARCLEQMQKTIDADIRPSSELDLVRLKQEANKQREN